MTPRRSQERRQVLTLVLLTTVTAVVSSLGAPLVPAIADQYRLALTDAQWVVSATMLAGAVATPLLGRLGSGRLRRPTILAGLVLVTLGSVLAALPLAFGALVVGRALQGIGLALVPLALAVARDVVRRERRARVIALLSVSTVAGAGLGYPLTALVAEVWGLAGAYALGAALTLATLAMAARFLPSGDGEPAARVDWSGAVLLSLGMVALLLAVTRGATWGWFSPRTLVLAAAGVLVLLAWIAWTLRREHPLVDLRLAVRPGVLGPNLTALMAGVGMYGLLTLVVVLVQSDGSWGLGQPVTVAGLMLVPYAVASVVGSQVARVVARRLGNRALLPVGCLLFFGASAALALEHDHLWQAVACMALAGTGSGLTFSSLAVLMLPHVPRPETGSALALNQVLRYLGFTVGASLSVTLMALFGGGEDGFRASLLILSSTSVLAAGVAFAAGRPRGALVAQPA